MLGDLRLGVGTFLGIFGPPLAFFLIACALKGLQTEVELRGKDVRKSLRRTSGWWLLSIVVVLALATVGISWLLAVPTGTPSRLAWITDLLRCSRFTFKEFDGIEFAILVGAFAVAHFVAHVFSKWTIWRFVCAFISGGVGGAILYAIALNLLVPHAGEPYLIVTIGPPIVLLAFIAAVFTEVALLGRAADEQEREWQSRLSAWVMLVATVWAVVSGLSLYGSLWLWQAGRWWQAALAAGWVTSAVGGVLAARSVKTNGHSRRSWLDLVGMVAPFVFLVGLGCAMSLLASWLVDADPQDGKHVAAIQKIVSSVKSVEDPKDELNAPTVVTFKTKTDATNTVVSDEVTRERRVVRTPHVVERTARLYWWGVENAKLLTTFAYFCGAIIVAGLATWRVDINEFSLNAMYANRLGRCYLGASRRKRTEDLFATASHAHGRERYPNSVTGFDPDDDFPLSQLRIGVSPVSVPESSGNVPIPDVKDVPYWGPFPLINAALNLVAGDQLAWQERMAESFVLSPLYCGANSLGYREGVPILPGAMNTELSE